MTIRVVAAVIERKGRVLLCERPAHKRHGGLWEFPGGKVEPGESRGDALRRELREELGVEVVATGGVAFSIADPGSQFIIDFVPVEIEGEPECLEHAALAWVADEDLASFALAPSDRQYAAHRMGPTGAAERRAGAQAVKAAAGASSGQKDTRSNGPECP